MFTQISAEMVHLLAVQKGNASQVVIFILLAVLIIIIVGSMLILSRTPKQRSERQPNPKKES